MSTRSFLVEVIVHAVRAAVGAALLTSTAAAALQDADEVTDHLREHLNVPRSGLAIEGYDPVAYFPEGGGDPKKGAKTRTVEYRGATYRFASDANRDRFLAMPSHYAPAYGGWCAYAMADDDRVEIDPESFLIEDGSLLLFFDGFFADTRNRWLKEGRDELRGRADGHWTSFADEMRHRDVLGWSVDANGVALGGFDPMTYVLPNAEGEIVPRAGSTKFTTTVRGLTYRFASDANRRAFLRAPSSYEPAFGGLDPLRLIAGEAVAADPARFARTKDGRLVLFAAPAGGEADPVEAWSADRDALERRARAAFTRHVAALREAQERSAR